MILILMLAMLSTLGFARKRGNDGVSFFSKGSFYLYLEGGFLTINPNEAIEYWDAETDISLVYGAGLTLLNFHDRYKLNFEFDFASPAMNAGYNGYSYKQTINFFNYLVNFEYLFPSRKVSLFAGIGMSTIKYLENDFIYDYSTSVLLLQTGFKFAITRNLLLRAEFKYFGESFDYDDYYYVYDDYYDYYDFDVGVRVLFDDYNKIATAFSVGLEWKL